MYFLKIITLRLGAHNIKHNTVTVTNEQGEDRTKKQQFLQVIEVKLAEIHIKSILFQDVKCNAYSNHQENSYRICILKNEKSLNI